MKKKLRKFSEGGFETAQGENENIKADTRARALRSVMPDDSPAGTSGYGEQNETPVTKTVTRTSVTAPAKPKVDMDAERARIEEIGKKQALEPVHPEDYVPGPGMLKPLLRKVVSMGAKRAEAAAAESVAKNAARKAEEGFNPSEALDALKPTRTRNIGGKDVSIKQGTPRFETPSSGVGKEVTNKAGKKIPIKRKSSAGEADDGGSGAFKRGGSVRSSASRRADGCAIRGKTRA